MSDTQAYDVLTLSRALLCLAELAADGPVEQLRLALLPQARVRVPVGVTRVCVQEANHPPTRRVDQ